MTLTSGATAASDETNDGAEGDATKRAVVDDGGTDAAVDPGLGIAPDDTGQLEADEKEHRDSTNHTGLTPDSIPVD